MTLTAQQVQQIIHDGLPAAEQQGIEVRERDGGVVLRCPFRPEMVRPGGTVSGPSIMAAADAAMYAAILARLGRVEMAVTQNLNINFLARPKPAALLAEPDIIRLGRRSAVLEVRVYSEGEDTLVAHVTGIYALPGGQGSDRG